MIVGDLHRRIAFACDRIRSARSPQSAMDSAAEPDPRCGRAACRRSCTCLGASVVFWPCAVTRAGRREDVSASASRSASRAELSRRSRSRRRATSSRALREIETILVHGDYDVDGICSTTLMVRAIRHARRQCDSVHPATPRGRLRSDGRRRSRGAGCGREARHHLRLRNERASGRSPTLQASGIDVIVTDHHLPGGPLPPAYAVLNPNRPDCTSSDKDLAAVGVAFKLALALTRARRWQRERRLRDARPCRPGDDRRRRAACAARIGCSFATGSSCSTSRSGPEFAR